MSKRTYGSYPKEEILPDSLLTVGSHPNHNLVPVFLHLEIWRKPDSGQINCSVDPAPLERDTAGRHELASPGS